MTAMSDFLENAMLDLVLRGTAYPGSGTVYAALFTTPTTDAGGGNEVVGGGYTRVLISSFDPPAGGICTNAAAAQFPTAAANWGTVTHFALFDAPIGGNMLYHGPLTAAKIINAGDTYVLPPGNITITHD